MCCAQHTLFHKESIIGRYNMWKQATKMQQISPCYPFIHAGKVLKGNKVLGS